jgi:hypothetical protein
MSLEISPPPKTAEAGAPTGRPQIPVRSLVLTGAIAVAGITGLGVAAQFREPAARLPAVQRLPSASASEGRVHATGVGLGPNANSLEDRVPSDPCALPKAALDGHPTQRRWSRPAGCPC